MSHIPTLVVTTWLTPSIVFPDRPWRNQWHYRKKYTVEWDTMCLDLEEFFFPSHTPLHWMGQTVLLGSSASRHQSHSCSRWAAHSAQWASVQQPWQTRIQQVEMRCVSETDTLTHPRFLNSPLTVRHMMSPTPGAQMPGSPGSHTTWRRNKKKKPTWREEHTYSGAQLYIYLRYTCNYARSA